jgi:hypothetical protein
MLSWFVRIVARMTNELDWTHELTEQLEWHWRNQLRPRLDGLTDAEYLWEPAPGAWSLRPRDQASTPLAAGAGDVVADFAYPEPDPAPITTIAWRLAHVSIGVLGTRAANHFGDGGVEYATTDWPLDAAGGLALLDGWYEAWISGVRSLGPDDLVRPCGPSEGPYAELSMAALVLHINREAIHHGAEVALLRDLYTWREQ